MTFLGGFLGAVFGCLAIGTVFIVIGGSQDEYHPHEKE